LAKRFSIFLYISAYFCFFSYHIPAADGHGFTVEHKEDNLDNNDNFLRRFERDSRSVGFPFSRISQSDCNEYQDFQSDPTAERFFSHYK